MGAAGVTAVILAGGQGTRLRPLTLSRPKPIVPLLNVPFLAYQLDLLRRHGVDDVVLSCSYMVDDVRGAMGDGRAWGVRLRYAVEDQPLGTAGGVRNAADLVSERVIVLNGDVLTDADLSAMQRFHAERGAAATIYLTRVPDPRAFGLVDLLPSGHVHRFLEKPGPDQITTDTINAGVYILDRTLLERIPPGRAMSIEREFFPGLLADGIRFYGWVGEHYWLDIGNAEKYRQGQLDLLSGRVRTGVQPDGWRDGIALGDGAVIEPGAQIQPPAVVGPTCRLAADSRVGPHVVLGAGCSVAARAVVEGSVLWDGVQVGEGAVLRDCIVASGASIAPRAQVRPGAVVAAGAVVAGAPVLS
ncbi:MAG TPA: NDP-sugar synthase [Candidatus Binatia bacterium]|nr:NDP-sugar synthase [Candidatus Binatia bacterium]